LQSIEQLVQRFDSKLSALEIHAAFERLKDLGLLRWNPDLSKFEATYQRLTTKDDVSNQGAREYHKQVAKLAIDSIEKQRPEEREFQSFAINVPAQKIKKLKEMMRRFRTQVEDELREGLEAVEPGAEELYQMNLQFFRLTDQPWSCSTEPTRVGARNMVSKELALEKTNEVEYEVKNEVQYEN
jgi:uncharacterized protein (TIGR02147 family)